MTFLLDPDGEWERAWTAKNPEPFPQPSYIISGDPLIQGWSTKQALRRIDWHAERWNAFRKAFPEWQEVIYKLSRNWNIAANHRR